MAGSALSIQLGGTSQTTAPGARIALGLEIGSDVQPFDSDLQAIADLGTTGIIVRSGSGTAVTRTITGTANRITITNGDGVAGNPTVDISTSYVGQATITTLGTITTGVWNGTDITVANGGTGVSTITGLLSGNGTSALVGRTITGTANQITVADGNGATANPTLSITTNPTLPGDVTISGDLTVSGGDVSGMRFQAPVGSASAVVLAADTNSIVFRPNTAASSSNQATLSTAGVFATPSLTVGGGTNIPTIVIDTWTPTLFNTTNVDSSTALLCQYIRIGNRVMCWGILAVDPTAAVNTVLGISLPVASNLGAATDLFGVATTQVAQIGGRIGADTVNDRATLTFLSSGTANVGFGFTFSYNII